MNFMKFQPPVVRFQDTALLPLSSPADHPNIIKSGLDSEANQHPKLPPVTGPDGVATLLYHLGQPALLERLLDVDGTAMVAFRVKPSEEKKNDMYVRREGSVVEIGLVPGDSKDETQPSLGVRYAVDPRAPSSPCKTGAWVPQSSSENGSAWGGTPALARARGAALARTLWQTFHLQEPETSARAFDEGVQQRKKEHKIEHEKLKAEVGIDAILAGGFEDYKKTFLRCRADCGVEVATMRCSKCHFAKYCKATCQTDDWKYHKTYCGKEDTWDFSNEKFEDLLKPF